MPIRLLCGMPLPRLAAAILSVAFVAAAPAPPADPPQMPSQLYLPAAASGYRFAPKTKAWRPTTFGEQTYILRALNDTDRRNFAGELARPIPAPTFGLFAFGTGALNGWCSVHALPFIKPKLLCRSWDGTLDIDLDSERFDRSSRGGFIEGSDRTMLVELGSCSPIVGSTVSHGTMVVHHEATIMGEVNVIPACLSRRVSLGRDRPDPIWSCHQRDDLMHHRQRGGPANHFEQAG